MLSHHVIRKLRQDAEERLRLSVTHCSGIRQTIGENTRLVEQSIELMLGSKEALRQVDEALNGAPARAASSSEGLHDDAGARRQAPAQDSAPA